MGCIRNKQIVTRCTSPITHTHTHASYIKTFPFYTTKLILVNELKNKNNTGQLTRYTTTTTTDSWNRTKTSFFFSPLSILLLKSLKQEKAEKQKFIFRNQTSHFIHRIFLYLYIFIFLITQPILGFYFILFHISYFYSSFKHLVFSCSFLSLFFFLLVLLFVSVYFYNTHLGSFLIRLITYSPVLFS